MKRRIIVTAILAALGAVVGAVAAPILSFLGTAVAQASMPSGYVVYHYGPLEFAVVGAIGIPILAWLLMRRVPLWRAIAEPTIGAAIGLLLALASIPVMDPPIIAQPLFVLAGTLGAALRLRHAHRPAVGAGEGADQTQRLNAT